ncbi:MAG: hypothetical protein AB9856_06220 [Cellulosilyticaceae bacterium]
MSLSPKFSAVDKAILTATGNTLVICGSATAPDVNTSDMTTLGGGTTRDWRQAGSRGTISILANSTILYAELIWYSTVASNVPGTQDVRSVQDDPVVLTTPLNNTIGISPQYTEDYTTPTGSVSRFRSANVTQTIVQYLGGIYGVSKVPTSIPSTGLSDSKAGWTLVVSYRHDSFLPQKVGFTSGIGVATAGQPYQMTITGFTTEADPKLLKASLFLAAANGEPLTGEEIVSAGPSFANLTVLGNTVGAPNPNPLTAPNNPYNNFFAGEINVCNPLSASMGLLDISGSSSNFNNDAFVPQQVVGARNKWDLTALDISQTLVTNQTMLAGQLSTSGPSNVAVLGLGAQVRTIAPDVTAVLSAYDSDGDSEFNVEVGENIVYTIQVKNSGQMAANNVLISMGTGLYSNFVPGTVSINGVVQPTADITTGVNLGSIASYGVTNVAFECIVTQLPPVDVASGNNLIVSKANYSYQFVSGITNITNTCTTNQVQVMVEQGKLEVVKSVSSLTATIGQTLNYTIDITNVGNALAQNVFFQDKIDDACSFVEHSVTIGGISYPDLNPHTGFELANLAVNGTRQIKFAVTVESLPASTKVTNSAAVSFGFVFNQYVALIEKTTFSNTVSIQVQYIDIIGIRSNNNSYPEVGDTVTYTLKLTNMGNIPASGVQVQEPLVAGATFVGGSVKINGQAYINLNPFTGFPLPNPIPGGQTTNITYDMLINQVQPGDTIDNTAQVPFKYQITPAQGEISDEKASNTVETRANFVCMSIQETVDKAYAVIDDILYYTVTIENQGNINAYNTIFSSQIQADTTFVAGSVKINGITYGSYDPNQGFTIGTVYPTDSIEVTYQTKVITVPSPNLVYNQSQLIYSYLPDPLAIPLTKTITSNRVQTIINRASYTITKSVDKAYAVLGDNLVYTTTITNTGTVVLTDISFVDNLPTFLQFYPHTVYVNGSNYPNYNPSTGFAIPDLHPGDSTTVVFATTVIDTPAYGYVLNSAKVTMTYQVNPNSPVVTRTAYSNRVKTYIVTGDLSIHKMVNKAYATIDDIIAYSFDVSNVGNVPLTNVNFTDIVPIGASFVADSVIINDVSKPGYNPNQSFILGDLNVGQVTTVSFNIKVNTVPTPNTLINTATSSFSFTIDPTQQPERLTKTSNTVTTVINKGDATLSKVVDKLYATIGETLTYTITARNTGTVTLSNVNFLDIVQAGGSFIADSVVINSVEQPGLNPNIGFALPDILASGDVIVSFKVSVTSVPTPPQIQNNARINYQYKINPTASYTSDTRTSNTATTMINRAVVAINKTANKQYATVGNTVTYTSVISNSGNINLTNTLFKDSVPEHTSFVSGTVTINGTSFPTYNPNTGFTAGTVQPNTPITVVFNVTVDSFPPIGYITNTSNMSYEYTIDPTQPPIPGSVTSNEATTHINIGTITFTKVADRQYARITDTINYTLVVTNTGNTVLKNISFQDIIQAESTFTGGSVVVNGTSKPAYNPNTGFALEDIPVGSYTTINFAVTVNSIPQDQGKLNNTGSVTYSYYVDPVGNPTTKTESSNTATVIIRDTIVSATKSVDKSIAKLLGTLNFTITLENDGNAVAEHAKFKDTLDTNLLFTSQSVYINNVQYPSYNPNTGFDLPNIVKGTPVIVTFAATIQTRPVGNIVYNTANVQYDYIVGGQVIQGAMTTNTTQTYVAVGELTLTKAVDKLYATVGNSLSYTILVKNTGSVVATSLTFKDTLQAQATFNVGTVEIDGVSYPTYNPNTGFSLTNLNLSQEHTVTFTATVNALPVSGEIENTASTEFTYQILTEDPVTITAYSNKVTTTINLGKLMLSKVVSKQYATLEDTLTYTINVTNQGNVTCSSVTFRDIVQANAQFVTDSVKINDVGQPGLNPNTGFSLSNIVALGTVKVEFDVTVKTLPSDYTVYNTATSTYQYYIDPTAGPTPSNATSNTVATQINVGSLNLTKAVNKAYATIGDKLIYTIGLVNNGNVMASNINFRDVIPVGITFDTGSVTIDSVSYPTYDPYQSFSVGSLDVGESTVVKFSATVTALPNPSLVSNTANSTFYYKIDPNGSALAKQTNSNTVTTQINVGVLAITKAVNKAYATRGDILMYTFAVRNTGNVDLTNVMFLDNLQEDITFNVGSVIVGGTPQPSADPTQGISLGTLATLATVNISFTVTVVAEPRESSILNYAIGTFSYKVDPSGGTYTSSVYSNTVSTILELPKLEGTVAVDLMYATLTNTLNYTINYINSGNTILKQLFLVDTLSSGGAFIPGTVKIDGVSYPNYDPITGFGLPDLVAGNTTKIEFQANVAMLPVPPQITDFAVANGVYKVDPSGADYPISATTNTVTTYINVGSLTNTKSVDKLYAKLGDTLTYTSIVKNVGNVNATNINFADNLQADVSYVAGTVRIDSILYPTLNPALGFALANLAPGQSTTVTFDVVINTLPIPPQVNNQSQATFSYKIDPNGSPLTSNSISNLVTTQVVKGQINATKVVDKPIATIGDTLTYTVTLINAGNVIAKDVFFQDIPTTGVTFVSNSVKVNNVTQAGLNPITGFTLGDIGIGQVITVQFVVDVVSVPPSNVVTNQATITFKFVVDPKDQPFTQTTYSNTVTTNIAKGSLSVTKAVDKKFATIGENLTYTVTIVNTGNINATNVQFIDPTPNNAVFVTNSVFVNGLNYPSY